MAKKRKNSFGTMFGGAFGNATDARKKARKVHGKVTPKIINGHRRYMVTSERKNPIKRRKNVSFRPASKIFDTSTVRGLKAAERYKARLENKYDKVTTVPIGLNQVRITGIAVTKNPAELIVLGANPAPAPVESYSTPQEFVLPPNSTITIRTNPVRANAGHGYGYDFHGAFTNKADAVAKEKVTPGAFIKGRITPNGYRWIVMTKPAEPRQNVEFGEFDHGIFHPWTRRPKSRRKRATRRLKTRSNPSAAALREAFTGMPADWETIQDEPHMPGGDYAQLGELLALYVKPARGQQVQQIKFEDRPMLVSDESARQIYFVGGDQDISGSLAAFGSQDHGGGHFQLGEVRRIDYKQRKEHVPHPSIDEWRHDFGEETGVRPVLWFDANTRRLMLKGGEYEIRTEGIVN